MNSIDGLYQYITASNIKYKIKNPLFLAIKFSNCVKLYYKK